MIVLDSGEEFSSRENNVLRNQVEKVTKEKLELIEILR